MTGVICLFLVCSIYNAYATNWQANTKPGSDIMMNDLRWPEWKAGTYYCFWYSGFVPGYSSLYGGAAISSHKTPGLFTSYWGVTKTIYEGDGIYGKGFGGEGSKGGAGGKPEFQRPNSWYRMVMRTFPPTLDADKNTNVGWWIKDVENNKWYIHSILQIPSVATGFSGNSGFVEALGGDAKVADKPGSNPRVFERRLAYCRLNGTWYDSPLSAIEPSKFRLIEKDTVVRFEIPIEKNTGKTKEPVFFQPNN